MLDGKLIIGGHRDSFVSVNRSSMTLSEWETDDLQYKNKVGTLYVARKLTL